MAGMLRVGDESWSASYGLFDWVVDALADRVDDPATAARLREITHHALGHLDTGSLAEPGRSQVLALLPTLPEVAARELPASPGREEVLDHVRTLAALAGP